MRHRGTLVAALSFGILVQAGVAAERPAAPAAAPTPPTSLDTRNPNPPQSGMVSPAQLAEFVDGAVQSYRRENDLAALTVAVVKDDTLWLARGFGQADIASGLPVLADETLFRIGSVSKTFTWTAVMMLVERGLVDLDEDVNTYLKGVRVREAFGRPVTLRHLMHHRAGFEDTFRLFAVTDEDPRPLAELLAAHQPRRVYPPGARTSYSNWGAALAAQIVEDAAGVPYGEFLRREILAPLGMHDTTWQPPSAMDAGLRGRLATGYRPKSGALGLQGFMQIGAYWPAGGMAATATDMARWMRFLLNGGELDGVRLLSADTHAAMWTRGFSDRPEGADLAHGFIDSPHRGLRTLGHAGGTAAFLTNMVLVPELGLGVFLSQSSAVEFSPLAGVPAMIIDRFLGQAYQPSLAESDGGSALADLAGTFLNNRRVFSSFSAVLGLAGAASVAPVSDAAVVVRTQGEEHYFLRVGASGDVFEDAAGDRITFLRETNGTVRAFADATGVHTFERVGPLRNPGTLFAALGLAGVLAVTTILGAWKRFGRRTSRSFGSRAAAAVSLLAVVAVGLLLAAIAVLAAGLSEFDLSSMPGNYPSLAMYLVHYAGWFAAAAALAMVAALRAAWGSADWPTRRKLHFTLFALVLAFLTLQLWLWRIIGAAVA